MKAFSTMIRGLILFVFTSMMAYSGPGDTVVVQTFDFSQRAPYEGKFLFPEKSVGFEKILMCYKLKCNPEQSPACGEWDYLTYTYLYEHTGRFDSTGKEILIRYELGRFITPYGIGLDLGEGWTWIYDVTDFRPLLCDSVHLTAGNWQELLDLKFLMIEGSPPRDVVRVENVWNGDFALNRFAEQVRSKTLSLDPSAESFRLKVTTTGHQFSNATNCAEFCPKIHSVDVAGITGFSWQILQECAMNPLYPQGGTWIYDRAGWCPGMPAATRNLELTPFVTGSTLNIDYNAEYDDFGNYVVESQLISYGPAKFRTDASILDIITPSSYEIHRRYNPTCTRQRILIRNNGKDTLTSLKVTYGPIGGNSNSWNWTGKLSFLEEAEITLPAFDWGNWSGPNRYVATLSQPNGVEDEYPYNNSLSTDFQTVDVYNKNLIVVMRTNNAASETWYEVKDADGAQVLVRSGFANNGIFRDTLRLAPGCYDFILHDTGDDGLSFWANSDGSGYLQFRLQGGSLWKSLNADFGKETRYSFRIDPVSTAEFPSVPEDFEAYPNPTARDIVISFKQDVPLTMSVHLTDMAGRIVKRLPQREFGPGRNILTIPVEDLAPASYILHVERAGRPSQRVQIRIVR